MATTTSAAAEYNFKGGYPTAETIQKARDETDFQRAVTAYRFWYPTVSCEGLFNGNHEIGARDNESLILMACGPRQVVFTGNSDTPYGAAVVDLKDGPWVVEIPPGPYIALAMDHHQRWILDKGENLTSHSLIRSCGDSYQVKFIGQSEGGKYGDTETINSKQTKHRVHHGR